MRTGGGLLHNWAHKVLRSEDSNPRPPGPILDTRVAEGELRQIGRRRRMAAAHSHPSSFSESVPEGSRPPRSDEALRTVYRVVQAAIRRTAYPGFACKTRSFALPMRRSWSALLLRSLVQMSVRNALGLGFEPYRSDPWIPGIIGSIPTTSCSAPLSSHGPAAVEPPCSVPRPHDPSLRLSQRHRSRRCGESWPRSCR